MRNMVRVTRFTLFPLVAKLGALLLFLPPCSAGAAVRGAEMVVPCAVSAFDDTLEWLCALKDPAGAPLLRVDEIRGDNVAAFTPVEETAFQKWVFTEVGEKIAEGPPREVIEDPEVKRVYMGIEA